MVRISAPTFSAPTSRWSTRRPSHDSVRFSGNTSSTSKPQAVAQDTVELAQAQPHHSQEITEANTIAMAKELLRAIKAGNADEVQTHLTAGADPNARDRLFYTALHRAVEQNSPTIVSRLLRKGADPNTKSPLFAAPALHQDPNDPRGQKVLQVGGDPSTMTPVTQETPLDRALHHHKRDVIPVLIASGAECTDAQRPRVREALKQLYGTDNLTACLENAVRDMDVQKAQVLHIVGVNSEQLPRMLEHAVRDLDVPKARLLLTMGINSKKLPTLYTDLLNTTLDTAKAKTTENQAERANRCHQHVSALQLMSLLTQQAQYAKDYRELAPAIAANQRRLLSDVED